jgi:ribokinase
VFHAGKVGRDGVWIKELMQQAGVDVSRVLESEHEISGRGIIQLADKTHENAIVFVPGTNKSLTAEDATRAMEGFGCEDWLLLQNEVSAGEEALRIAAEKDMAVVFNPAPFEAAVVKGFQMDRVHVLVLNKSEAEDLSRAVRDVKRVEEVFKWWGRLKVLVVTKGAEGAVAWLKDGEREMVEIVIPAEKADVMDTTGAGDTFTGYFVAAMLRARVHPRDESFIETAKIALHEAVVAAALTVEREGGMEAIPLLEQVKARMEKSDNVGGHV